MFKLIFTNSKGESVELFSSPYRLMRFEGLGDVGASHQSQKSYNQDGSTLVNTTLDERHPEIELKITGRDEIELARNRRRLTHVFNPKLGEGTLERVSDDGVHQLKTVAESVPYYPDGRGNRSRVSQKALINLYCPNPYWLDKYDTSEEVITWIGGSTFPLRLPTTFAMAGEKVINVYNDGDVGTPVTLEIYGPAINPKVVKRDTGEFIRIKKTLTSDDYIKITTEFGNKRVELNGENAFNLLDLPDSKFFNLDVGDNVIELITEDATSNAKVKIKYRNRYLGV